MEEKKYQGKTIFLKSDKIGEGELGSMLTVGFLKAMIEQKNLPQRIICVNSAVLLTTASNEADITNILKQLEVKGVEIYSCGTCLDYFEKREELKVGVPGNAMDTIAMLLDTDTITL